MFDRPAAIRARLGAPLTLVLAIALAWFAVDVVVYRSGAYLFIAEPDSNTGAVVSKLLAIDDQYVPGARNVIVFGDSRVGAAFSAPLAGGDDASINFINLSVPGSTPRTWYYLLREIDRRGYRVDAVVVGTIYNDTSSGLRANWSLDPAHAAPLVGVRDAASFPASFESPPMRERARHTVLFPALALRQDTLALLASPLERLRAIRVSRPGYLASVRGYPGREDTMPALQFGADRNVLDWHDATPEQRALVTAHLAEPPLPPADIARANDAFLGHWLGAMATLAHGRGAPMLVYPLPRGPYPAVLPPLPPLPPSLAALQRADGMTVLPPDTFASLEDPAYFFDVLHGNRKTRAITSARIADATRAMLAGAPPR